MSKTKVYIASRYARRDEAATVAQKLRDTGQFVIVSTWHDGEKDNLGDNMEQGLQTVALKDLVEVTESDMVLTLSDVPGGYYQYGSHHVEFGAGYVLNKQSVIIGPRELMFHRLPGVLQFDTLGEFLHAFGIGQVVGEARA